MASPFPGMDPYLEDPEHWRSFHHHLAEEITRQLNPQIVPKYFADVELRTVLQEVGIALEHAIYPDTSVYEVAPEATRQPQAISTPTAPIQRAVELPGPVTLRAVHIYASDTKTLVSSIEVLSPVNKIGEGLREYRQKRSRLLHSDVHLVEIDFLRRGERPGRELMEPSLDTDYIVLVNRNRDSSRRISDIWPIALNEPLPTIPIPLLAPDDDALLDLAAVVAVIYATFHYELRIDYTQPVPPPALRPAMQIWLDQKQ